MMTLRTRYMLLHLLCGAFTAVACAQAAVPPADQEAPVKEARLAAGSFTRGQPLPQWALPLAPPPPTRRTTPVVIRLAETQMHAGTTQSVLVHRAVQINDKAALGVIGQYPMHFVPQYQ